MLQAEVSSVCWFHNETATKLYAPVRLVELGLDKRGNFALLGARLKRFERGLVCEFGHFIGLGEKRHFTFEK